MKRSKSVLALIVAVSMALGLAACTMPGDSDGAAATENTGDAANATDAADNTEASVSDASDITIAVVPKSLDNSIFLDSKTGAEKAAKDLGINLEWVGSAKSDASEQVTVIEGLIQKKVDGILISCNDADALKDVIDRAMDAGISVATFDSDSPESKRIFYAGTDNYAIGAEAAGYMKELLPDGGSVAILTGVLGAPNLEMRITGFQETLEGSNIECLPVMTGEDDVQKSVEVVNQFTAANSDLDAWFFVGGWPYFADPEALPEINTFMKNGGRVISIDTAYPMLQYLGLDMVDILIGQAYEEMGYIGVTTLYDAIQGKELDLPEDNYINTGSEVVTKDNWEEVLAGKTPWE